MNLFQVTLSLFTRTSRRGGTASSWIHPPLRDQSIASLFSPGKTTTTAGSSAASASSPASSSIPNGIRHHPLSSPEPYPYTIHAADNAQSYDRQAHPHRHNWKASAPMPGHFTYADYRDHLKEQRAARGGNREKTAVEQDGSERKSAPRVPRMEGHKGAFEAGGASPPHRGTMHSTSSSSNHRGGDSTSTRQRMEEEEEELDGDAEWGKSLFSMYSFSSPHLDASSSSSSSARGQKNSATRDSHGGKSGDTTSHHGTVSTGKNSWRGGREQEMSGGGEGPELGGAASGFFRKGRPRTITELCTNLLNAAFEPRASDSKAFGGDGATERAERKEELKHLDPRISPIFHKELMADGLRCVQSIRAPSGAIIPNGREALLKGRLVGLLFFSETERCMAFMRHLRTFHEQHHPDFLVVAISLAGTNEMLDLTRGFGYYHLTHRNGGATWVIRDVGLEVKPFLPLPRLIIVDGTTGKQLSRRGVTEVWSHPDKCMSWWKNEESDCSFLDVMRTWYLSDGRD